jgi:hypothetical protein
MVDQNLAMAKLGYCFEYYDGHESLIILSLRAKMPSTRLLTGAVHLWVFGRNLKRSCALAPS